MDSSISPAGRLIERVACLNKHTSKRLSPTIAGVTLLSLGNGAPDFFASVVSFTRSNDGAVGLNSILGGAFFVSSAVLGVISFLVTSNEIAIGKASFIRDVIFFLFSLFILLVIISIGCVDDEKSNVSNKEVTEDNNGDKKKVFWL
ncbi:hypothetical protein JHK87_012111 [Glycine soja]|nr:hypothetical protein JHK87_012111 [Glycine soja]